MNLSETGKREVLRSLMETSDLLAKEASDLTTQVDEITRKLQTVTKAMAAVRFALEMINAS